ncbi:Exocyst complex component EXOC3/Sec6 [Trypanosoma melophagium]|uniref:Exocyst complex component EXOC3/Sec6 n=1 Tax=Trypanosoma melophagium TaxID=715481 RepID=UPI00351A9BA0|nr:Exocyst complex component EXOC3/Sec6 [Trypanosoma melophagium]
MQRRGSISNAQGVQTTNNPTEDADQTQMYSKEELFPFLTEADQAQLRQEVLTAINNELVHAESLEVTVPRLLRSSVNEAKELRRAINSLASSQMMEEHRAVQIIKRSSDRIQDLRALFKKQGELITQMDVTSGSYKQLRELHFLRDNILSVIKWAEALKEVRYEDMYGLVDQRKFAMVYKRLRRLQLIRRTVSEKSGASYKSYSGVFEPYFEKLDVVQTMFVGELYKLLEESSVHVAIQKALEDIPKPGTVSEPFAEYTQFEECVQICGEEIAEENEGGALCNSDGEPLITEEKVTNAVRKCVTRLWEEEVMIDVIDPFKQISTYLGQMKKISPLLTALEMTLIPLSTKFSFFAIVVGAIHNEVVNVLKGYIDADTEVDANGLLEASDFIQWYKETMMEANYASYIELSVVDNLSALMMTSAVGGLSTHLIRLCHACAISVLNGGNSPTTLPSGLPVTTGPMDMFAVLQQSLGGLSTAIEVGVMRQIGAACAQAIEAYLEECKIRSDYDYWEEENESSGVPQEEWSSRRLAFLYAFCNDCSTIERNMDTIELKFASYWDDDDNTNNNSNGISVGENASPFQKTQDLISEHALYYVDEIVLHVDRIVKAKWALVFRSKEWYDADTNPTRVIVDTMSDFIDEEFTKALEEPRARIAMRRMMTQYIHKYLTTLMEFLGEVIRHPNSRAVEDWNNFTDCLTRDTTIAMDMWGERVKEGRGQLVSTARRALELMVHLLAVSTPAEFNFVLQRDLLDDFGDCPTFVLRFLLLARRRLLAGDAPEKMLAVWRERIAHQRRGDDDVPTTGWPRPPSILGAIDRRLADLEQRGGLLRASPQKKRTLADQKRLAEEKEAKRQARKARREADAAAAKVKAPTLVRKPKGNDEVEVANLADLLK